MGGKADARKLIGEILSEIAEEARCGVKRVPIGVLASGSELGSFEATEGALRAMEDDPRIKAVMIGPKTGDSEGLEWIETEDSENSIAEAMDRALESGDIAGAVALHHPFPLGVATIGRVVTPAKGKLCFIASSTGTSAAERVEAMVKNAIYGISVAKCCGVKEPSVGIMNLDGAQTALRALEKLAKGGYPIRFGESIRRDGGAILRGNDLLAGAVDICVTDTLTGNMIMKLFSSWNTGGGYEAAGWGYGPSVGEGWKKVVSIISRASGAPVIANAIRYTAQCSANGLPETAVAEIAAAKRAGLDEVIASLQPKEKPSEEVAAPPAEPTDEEIHGIDVLAIEDAVKTVWKAGIYAESAMGCTGPVVKVAANNVERVKGILAEAGYL
jgi:hypothetical protein